MPARSKAAVKGPQAPAQAPVKKGDHVFLVDGSSYIFRAYFQSMNQDRKYNLRSDGLPTGGVRMFCIMLWRLLSEMKPEERPTHLAVVFDKSEKTFRNELYPDYKAHRPDPPDELRPQFPLMREAVHAFDLPCIEQLRFEADDLIATYARQASEAGATVTIVASDKDLMQLINDNVVMYDTMKDVRIGRAEVIEKFGVPPEQVIDVQALMGDSTDNVPGVQGIGPKAASTLISELGSLDRVLAAKEHPEALDGELQGTLDRLVAEITSLAGEPVKIGSGTQIAKILANKFGVKDLPEDKKSNPTADSATIERLANNGNEFCRAVIRARNISRIIGGTVRKIIENEKMAVVSKTLVTLDDKVALDVPLADLAVHQPDYKRLIAFLKAMEFTTLIRRVAEFSGVDAAEIEPDDALRVGGSSASTAGTAASPSPTTEGVRDGGGREGGTSAAPLLPGLLPPQPASRSGRRPAGGADSTDSTLTPSALAAARAEAARKIPVDRTKYETVRSLERLKAWVARAIDIGVVAVDIETTHIDPMQAELCGFSLALAPNEACYVPLAHRQGGDIGGVGLFAGERAADQIAEQHALAALKPLLEDPGTLKVSHNLKFDQQVFALRGTDLQPTDDTMLISYALDAGRMAHGTDALSERFLGHRTISYGEIAGSGKGEVCFDQVSIDKGTEYAAERADVTLRLWHVLKPRLAAEHVTTVYETLERPLIAVLARMERRGISIDRQVLSRLSGEFAQRAAGLEDEIQKLAGGPLNPGSPKQLGDILFGKMGLPGGKKTKTGAWSTSASVLEDLAEEGHTLAQRVLDWRQVSKLKSTYTDALPGFVNARTKRVHTGYALAATPTGRLSSSEPNLQNIPIRTEEGRKIRRAFIADPGTKLVSADYSQIELRLLAEIADIKPLRSAFQEGLDIHAMTASEMFGVPVQGMPGEVRRRAKAINFGIIYGISAFGLANQLGIPREEAAAYIKKYFERFPGIRAYMNDTREFCRKNGYVLTLFGRKCHYPDIANSNASVRAFNERACINARLQGTAADIIRRAMIRMEPALAKKKLSAQMLLQVHDELVFEVPDDEVEKTLPVVKAVMQEAPMPAVSLSVPLQVDARAADNWDEAH